MTYNAFQAGVVPFGFNAGDAFALTCRIGEVCVATQTKLPATVNIQFFWCFGMVEGRPVAVLAGDYAVQVFGTDLDLIAVALSAVFVHFLLAGITEFYGLLFPFPLVGLTVVGVHETMFPRTEIVGNIEETKYQ